MINGGGSWPEATQTIARFPTFLANLWDGASTVVVIAVDGVGLDVARRTWSPDLMLAMSTTFPSTSSAAWMTAVTGWTVDRHLVPGVRYREGDRLIDCFEQGPWPGGGRPAGLTTVFEQLARRNVRSLVIPGEVATWGAAWTEALCRGARVLESTVDWERIRFAARVQGRVVLARLRETVAAHARGMPLLIWCWIDVDDTVHRHGYTPEVLATLTDVAQAARELADQGHAVVALSDHGLTPTERPARMLERWAEATSPALCRLPPGGAGRVRWCYPHPGRAAEVLDRVADALGEDAVVVERTRLSELGLIEVTEGIAARVGEVVAIATGSRFPTPDAAARYEHGGITEVEMNVPLAVWWPR